MGRRCQATSTVNTYSDLPIGRCKIIQNVIHNGRFGDTPYASFLNAGDPEGLKVAGFSETLVPS
jgi:hypothetical protein